jgi:hypothetical protein
MADVVAVEVLISYDDPETMTFLKPGLLPFNTGIL